MDIYIHLLTGWSKDRVLDALKSRMKLATVHKYSIFTEFPQDGAYRLVEMQHCRNSVELLHEMLN